MKEKLFENITITNLRGNVDAFTNVAMGKIINLTHREEKKLIGYVGMRYSSIDHRL